MWSNWDLNLRSLAFQVSTVTITPQHHFWIIVMVFHGFQKLFPDCMMCHVSELACTPFKLVSSPTMTHPYHSSELMIDQLNGPELGIEVPYVMPAPHGLFQTLLVLPSQGSSVVQSCRMSTWAVLLGSYIRQSSKWLNYWWNQWHIPPLLYTILQCAQRKTSSVSSLTTLREMDDFLGTLLFTLHNDACPDIHPWW